MADVLTRCARCAEFPNEPKANHLVFKGTIPSGQQIKVIITPRFPSDPPRFYFDMQMQTNELMSLDYIDKTSMQIKGNYVRQWNPSCHLAYAMQDLMATVSQRPPRSGQPIPPQHQQQQ